MPPFDWSQYLATARFLAAQAGTGLPEEAACRSAVSRAYYAAYGYALRYASVYLGFAPRRKPEERAQDHGRLKAHRRSRRRANAAQVLDALRQWWNECDYADILIGLDPTTLAAQAVTEAERLIERILPPS